MRPLGAVNRQARHADSPTEATARIGVQIRAWPSPEPPETVTMATRVNLIHVHNPTMHKRLPPFLLCSMLSRRMQRWPSVCARCDRV
jgi:hypothetical protein